jgi:hypothetical protein
MLYARSGTFHLVHPVGRLSHAKRNAFGFKLKLRQKVLFVRVAEGKFPGKYSTVYFAAVSR